MGSRVAIAMMGGIGPILVGRYLAKLARDADRPKDIVDGAFVLPIVVVVAGTAVVWQYDRERRKNPAMR